MAPADSTPETGPADGSPGRSQKATHMELVENLPLDTAKIAALLTDREDMSMVWPVARWPFDPQQWQEALDPEKGHVSFIVCEQGRAIGHAALRKWEPPGTYRVSFLYILPECRSKGVGQKMLAALESYAFHRLGAERLTLVARDFNLPAINCYLKSGFRQTAKAGTRVDMEKALCQQPCAE